MDARTSNGYEHLGLQPECLQWFDSMLWVLLA